MSTSTRSFSRRIRAALLALAFALAVPLPVLAACPATTVATQATAIANGHAFAKHQGEFVTGRVIDGLPYPLPTIVTQLQFASLIEGIINAPDQHKALINNRTAYWSGGIGTVVIVNLNADDCGSVFRPNAGFTYYDELK